ncbi:hypothetical protein [Achromobacter pestifer]
MYENLDSLDPNGIFLKGLAPLSLNELEGIREAWPGIPEDYLQFLYEKGAGLMDDGFHFVFLRVPLNAESDVFNDDLIYVHGAMGKVCVFGHDQSGLTFGFDTGSNWRLVQVDEYREVVPIG